ncbi:MAG: hypothetical protein CM1200mP18_01360 [Gammaproteobacteria bacterium]|nr:MAG: hypothetical protein CM1200mP18_01360 [Gammaproteobacteria bacterium]
MNRQQEQLYAAYHDPELFERENDTLFACTWVNLVVPTGLPIQAMPFP